MNREQAKKALLEIEPNIDPDAIDWNDVASEISRGEKDPARHPEQRAKEEAVLAVLRQHRDFLRAEDEALAVWREVFVAQCKADPFKLSPSYLPSKIVDTASVIADEAETRFRRRLADHLKAKG